MLLLFVIVFVFVVNALVSVAFVIISGLFEIGSVIAEIYLLFLFFVVVVDVDDDCNDVVVFVVVISMKPLFKIRSVIDEMLLLVFFLLLWLFVVGSQYFLN